MKNQVITFILLIVSNFSFSLHVSAQRNFGEFFNFQMEGTDKRMMVRQKYNYGISDTNLAQPFPINIPTGKIHKDSLLKNRIYGSNIPTGIILPKPFEEGTQSRSPMWLGVKLHPNLTHYYSSDVKSITKSFVSYIISDSTDAIIIALGITPNNVDDYIYHVVENDSLEVIPWSPIPKMEQKYGAHQPYANLGTYNSPGKQILVEVVNTKDYSIRDGVIFDWRVDFTPKVSQISVSTNRNYFNLNYAKLNRGYATQFNPQTNMPTNLVFPVDSIDSFRFFLKNHETVPYQVNLTKIIDKDTSSTQIDYWILDDRYDFDSKHFKEPGKYELTIQRINANNRVKEEQKLHFKFQVLAPPLKEKSFSLIQFVYFGVGILLLFSLLLLFYYLVNKRKRKKINQQKQLIDLKLQSIQSQLNPHFMFNALSSIQNLMNKNDVEEANRFLGKFSKLTRKVLDSGNKDMISLEDELNILEDYLYMEQLRFNFNFEIKTDEIINKANTEVPTMLLQPLIENAVKHGVSTLNKDGIIRIHITMENNNLLLQVFDNGKGFSEELINGNSLGIKLVKERIELLNQIFEDQQIVLKIESTESGTTIVLNLKNWF